MTPNTDSVAVLRERALQAAESPAELHETRALLRELVSALDRAALSAQGEEPVAWIRFCSDGSYEGPIHDSRMEDVRKRSGAWTPLYPPAASGEAGAVYDDDGNNLTAIARANDARGAARATPPAASGELTEADKHALNTFATMAWGSAHGGYEAAQAAYRRFRHLAALVAGWKERDALWCEAIVNTQKWSAEFRALACDTVELLRYFNSHRPEDDTAAAPRSGA